MNLKKIALFLVILFLIFSFFHFELFQYFSLEFVKEHKLSFQNHYDKHPFKTLFLYLVIYILITALNLPAATLLTLLGGALFGFVVGVVLVSLGSTIGATLAFLSSRFLLKDWVESKFKTQIETINKNIKKEGAFYLFTLRVIPLVPFFVINLVMGLTSMKMLTFFFVSQIGMLLGTLVYVNAGTQLGQIESLNDILSFKLFLSFVLLGIFPFLIKKAINFYKSPLRKYKKPPFFDYNLVVIGAGAGGLVTSYISAMTKAKVALIEKHKMGGDCLNTGCVPSKTLIRSSKFIKDAKQHKSLGFSSITMDFEFADIMERIKRVIKTIEPHDSLERYRNLGVECLSGKAYVKSPYEVEIDGKTLFTKNIVIATGASPLVPPLEGLKDINYLTSNTLWDLKTLPQKLLILGGGPIGCELAQAFHRLGSEVVIVEKADRLLMKEDKDVSCHILQTFKKEGLTVFLNHRAQKFSQKTLECVNEVTKKSFYITFDKVILALGRKASVKGFGLEELGLELNQRQEIQVNEYLQTNYPNIYACGDVSSTGYQFTHTAAHEAWYCAVNSMISPFYKFKARFKAIPWCTYTDPEVARVGLNEQDALSQNISYEATTYPLDNLDRAITDEAQYGFIKVLTEPKKDKILGVTLVGVHAGDIIAEYVLAMNHKLGLNKILSTVHTYPTLSEANKFVAGEWKKKQLKPQVLLWAERIHKFRRKVF